MFGKTVLLILFTVFSSSMALGQQGAYWGLTLGGYGELLYNDVIHDANASQTPGVLDLRRFVLTAEYQYNAKFSFRSEIGLEPTMFGGERNGALAVDLAYVNMRLLPAFNIRAGLVPVPAGIVNVTREPASFHGVKRPNVETYIIPAIWREFGIGFFGEIFPDFTYESYLMAGLNPGGITGSNGIRHASQNNFRASTANIAGAGRISYDLNRHLSLGVTGYVSTLSHRIENGTADKVPELKGALLYLGEGHVKYTRGRFETRGLFALSRIKDIEELNEFFGNGAGQTQAGGYVEIAYDILPWIVRTLDQELHIFGRYESYDTNFTTGRISRNDEYLRDEITGGFSYRPAMGLIVKIDYQILTSFVSSRYIQQLNVGIGYTF